jgi:hypothetical protein
MKARLNYRGGKNQNDRMIADKEWSLNKALLYSYQSATAVIYGGDGKEQHFRCLINPNKITMEDDDKMLSIPFEDIDLNAPMVEGQKTSDAKVPIDVKVGSVIGWKENGTHWIVYMQYMQEIAYFRGLMRECDKEPLDLGNGVKRWVYIKGPSEKTIDWNKATNFMFNSLNYTLEMYVSKDSETEQYFHRFKKIIYRGRPWEV